VILLIYLQTLLKPGSFLRQYYIHRHLSELLQLWFLSIVRKLAEWSYLLWLLTELLVAHLLQHQLMPVKYILQHR
jgi:hypothetical protein